MENQVAEGDEVATRRVGTGTHEGELAGIAPTGTRVMVAGMDISRIEGGKIAEIWSNYDMLGLMHQLGAVPSPEEASAWVVGPYTPRPRPRTSWNPTPEVRKTLTFHALR